MLDILAQEHVKMITLHPVYNMAHGEYEHYSLKHAFLFLHEKNVWKIVKYKYLKKFKLS